MGEWVLGGVALKVRWQYLNRELKGSHRREEREAVRENPQPAGGERVLGVPEAELCLERVKMKDQQRRRVGQLREERENELGCQVNYL